MLRSEPPVDIEHLRRLLRYLQEPEIDWRQFGRILYYWNSRSKQAILQQYFTADTTFATSEHTEEANDE
jgi:CRISPR type I-E-associated protein CasB/Cse2